MNIFEKMKFDKNAFLSVLTENAPSSISNSTDTVYSLKSKEFAP